MIPEGGVSTDGGGVTGNCLGKRRLDDKAVSAQVDGGLKESLPRQFPIGLVRLVQAKHLSGHSY
jgi:hypothetical protein